MTSFDLITVEISTSPVKTLGSLGSGVNEIGLRASCARISFGFSLLIDKAICVTAR